MGAVLPQELLDTILVSLSYDKPALKNCSLASRTFLHLSRTYLFHKFHFDCLYRSQSLRDAYQFFKDRPHLVNYIRVLKMTGDLFGVLSEVGLLRHVSALLANLHTVELSGVDIRIALGQVFCHVPDILHRHDISSIHLEACWYSAGQVDHLLSGCRTLRHLCISTARNLSGAPIPDKGDSGSRTPIYLQTLEINAASTASYFSSLPAWLLEPQSTISITRLRTLRVAHLKDMSFLARLFTAASSSLENFEMEYIDNSRALDISLENLAVLRTLHFTSTFSNSSPEIWLKPLLSTVHSPNLVRITIDVSLDRTFVGPRYWNQLDDILTRSTFKNLRDFEVRMHPPGWTPGTGSKNYADARRGWFACENLRRQLEKLAKRGIAKVSYTL